jgi:hypothetical protein
VSVARLTTQLTPAENSQEEGMGDEDWQIIVYDMLKSTPTIPLDVLIKTATEVVKESKDEDTISRVVIFLQQTRHFMARFLCICERGSSSLFIELLCI